MGNAEYMGTHPIFESDFDCLTECFPVSLVQSSTPPVPCMVVIKPSTCWLISVCPDMVCWPHSCLLSLSQLSALDPTSGSHKNYKSGVTLVHGTPKEESDTNKCSDPQWELISLRIPSYLFK